MAENNKVKCPFRGEPMDRENVVCWSCFRLTNRLTPGDHEEGPATYHITGKNVAGWVAERDARMAVSVS